MANMNAKEIEYPCTKCKRANKTCCSWKKCNKYISWFSEKWREVTEPLKKGGLKHE